MPADGELLLRLRSGDERAFVTLVERCQEQMLRLAVSFVPSRAVAEEVVQDTPGWPCCAVWTPSRDARP